MTDNIQFTNNAFFTKVFSGEEGLQKEAADVSSFFIREKLREDGFTRKIMNLEPITAEDLDLSPDSDKPMKYLDKDFDTTAMHVPYRGTAERAYFTGTRYPMYFGKIESERTSKSIYELMTYRLPVQELFKEYNAKAMQEQEDKTFIESIAAMIDEMDAKSGETGKHKQTVANTNGDGIKEAFIVGQKMLTSLRLPIGCALMHKNTFIDSLNLTIQTMGNTPTEKRWERGIQDEDSFLGVPVVTTIKDNLVKEGEIYFFAPQEFFGKFYALQDATMVMKTEADMLTWWSYENIGIGIGNTNAAIKVTLS